MEKRFLLTFVSLFSFPSENYSFFVLTKCMCFVVWSVLWWYAKYSRRYLLIWYVSLGYVLYVLQLIAFMGVYCICTSSFIIYMPRGSMTMFYYDSQFLVEWNFLLTIPIMYTMKRIRKITSVQLLFSIGPSSSSSCTIKGYVQYCKILHVK